MLVKNIINWRLTIHKEDFMNKFTKKLLTVIMCMILVVALGSLVACNNDPDEPTKKLESIEITQQPTQTTFTEGDTLTYAGLKVKAHYDDESSAEVTGFTVTANNLDSANKLTTSSNKATVSYTEGGITKTAQYDITVAAVPSKNVESIEIVAQESVTDYYVGEPLSIKLAVTYDDDSTDTVTAGFATNPVAPTAEAGENISVTVTYGGKTDTIDINVYNKLTSIVVSGKDAYNLGEEFEGVTVEAFYNNATTNGVALESEKFDLSISPELNDNKFDQATTYTVTVEYSEELISGRKLEVNDSLEITVSVPLAWELTKVSFEKNGEKVYFVYSGTYENYTEEALKEALSGLALNLVSTSTDPWSELYNQDGYVTTFAVGADNTWTYKTEITFGSLNGFYVAGNYYANYSSDELYIGKWTVGDSVVVETETATNTYEFIDSTNYWGNISFKIVSRAIAQPGEPFWELTKASLVEDNGQVYFVYSGNFANYNEEDLKSELSSLKFDIVYPINDWPHANKQDGFTTIFEMGEDTWTYKTEITVGHLNGYYKVGTFYIDTASGEPYSSIWTIGEFVEVDNKKYEFVSPYNGWGIITFMITDTTPIGEIPEEYDLEFSTQDAYVANNQLLGRWVYYHNLEESNPSDRKANGRYDHGTLTFNFSENTGNWWCTQLFYTDVTLTNGTKYTVSLTLSADFSGIISVCGNVYTLVANGEPQNVSFDITPSASAATLNVAFGKWTAAGGEIGAESGQLIISNISFTPAGAAASAANAAEQVALPAIRED